MWPGPVGGATCPRLHSAKCPKASPWHAFRSAQPDHGFDSNHFPYTCFALFWWRQIFGGNEAPRTSSAPGGVDTVVAGAPIAAAARRPQTWSGTGVLSAEVDGRDVPEQHPRLTATVSFPKDPPSGAPPWQTTFTINSPYGLLGRDARLLLGSSDAGHHRVTCSARTIMVNLLSGRGKARIRTTEKVNLAATAKALTLAQGLQTKTVGQPGSIAFAYAANSECSLPRELSGRRRGLLRTCHIAYR